MNTANDKTEIAYDVPLGGYHFTAEDIDANVPEGVTGVYLLSMGLRSSRGNLFVDYVGRAVATEKEDVRKRLHAHRLNREEQEKAENGELVSIYKWFWFYFEKDDLAAYNRECEDFHLYGKIHALLNKNHPSKRPGHPDDHCPVSGCDK